jgi:hypothetical protein
MALKEQRSKQMALFVDGPPASIEDLTNQDSGLLDVCRTEQINASTKLMLAAEEIGVELEALFERQRFIHFFYSGQTRLNLHHLAVTTPVKLWHTRHTLALIYRDAYFNQLNDRFQAKWNEYAKLANSARAQLQEVGVGVVLDPIPRPPGPILTPTPATEVGGIFYFSVTLLNAACEESAGAPPVSIQLANGNAVSVQLTSQPPNARGWNVYTGVSPAALFLQNESPLATDDEWVFYPSAAIATGRIPGSGQQPTYLRPLPRFLQRG